MKDLRNVKLNDGNIIPSMGIGVFLATPEVCENSVLMALNNGIRHIDTAVAYLNEKAVGRAIKKSGIKREELYITTKLWPTQYNDAARAIDELLERLDTNYVDLLLLHQPYGEYVKAYKAMEDAVKAGKVRSIGLSNFDMEYNKFEEIINNAEIMPAVLQVEAHPYYQQAELKEKISKYGTKLEAWYPLGHGDKTLMEQPVFEKLANKYNKSKVQIILRWHLQDGNIIFPGANKEEHLKQNIDIFDFELTDDEMKEIKTLDCGKRYYYMQPEEAAKAYLSIPLDEELKKEI